MTQSAKRRHAGNPAPQCPVTDEPPETGDYVEEAPRDSSEPRWSDDAPDAPEGDAADPRGPVPVDALMRRGGAR
jgi:hypothetical protein